MKTTNMGDVKNVCLFLLVFVNLQCIAGKPIFGRLFCDFMCIDDDDYDVSTSSSTTTSMEDLFWDYLDPCSGCPTRRPTTPRVTTSPPTPFGFPPGMNGTMPNGAPWPWPWYGPWPGPWPGPWMGPPTPQSGATTTAAPSGNAASTTAAPAASTTAAGSTTAAATTAAATTAAA